MHLRSLARVVIATSGRAVLVRASPLVAAVGIGAAIVFGGSGMHPRDLVLMLASSAPFRLATWAAWIAMAMPAAAAAFDAPGTVTLRALRPPRAIFAMLALLLAALQVPWISLYAIGAGPLDALAAALLGVAATAAASSIRSRRGLAFLVATAVVIGLAPPAPLALGPAALLAWSATRNAWREALEARPSVRIVRRSSPAISLASAYVARMARSALARVQAAGIVVLAAGGALALTLRNDPDARPLQRTLVVLALPLATACALLAAPAVETEAALRPILKQARTSGLTLFVATALALATPTSAFAATAGTVATLGAHAPATLPIAAIAWVLPIACAMAAWSRRASRARRPSTFVIGAIAIGVAFTLVPASC